MRFTLDTDASTLTHPVQLCLVAIPMIMPSTYRKFTYFPSSKTATSGYDSLKSTCRSCRFDAKMSNADAMKSPGPPTARNSPSAGSPRSARDSPDRSSLSGEPLGLGEGEEFILVKVSHTRKKCWATFLNDDPEHSCDGHGHFALSASVDDILERRRQHHAILDAEARSEARRKTRRTMSPNRDCMFPDLEVQEQGEESSPGLRKSAKAAPPTVGSSSSEAWDSN